MNSILNVISLKICLGRFDRQISVTLPTLSERIEIFNVYLKQLKLEKPYESYSSTLAEYTAGFSGADISNFCNEAALHAGSNKHEFISDQNFWYAIERVKFGLKKRSGGNVQQSDRKKFAYHEAGHAIVAWMLEHTAPLLRVCYTREILIQTHCVSASNVFTTILFTF